jgi:hypothetical protein
MTNGKKLYAQVGVHLSDADLIDMGEALAGKRLESQRLEAEKAEHAAEFKATEEYRVFKEEADTIGAKITTIEAEADVLAKQIDAREKIVDVEIREEADAERNMIAIIRVDNNQLIKTRAMTLNEMAEARQTTLPLSDADVERTFDTEPPPADVAGEEEQLGREKLVKLDPKARRAKAAEAAAAEKAAE